MLGVFLIRSEAAGVRNTSHVIWVTTCLTVYSKKNRRSHVNDCLWLYPGFAVWTGEDGGGAQTLVSPDHPERTGQPWMIAPHWEKSAALQSPWPPSPVRSSFWYRPVLPDHHTVLKGNQDSRSDLHWPTLTYSCVPQNFRNWTHFYLEFSDDVLLLCFLKYHHWTQDGSGFISLPSHMS